MLTARLRHTLLAMATAALLDEFSASGATDTSGGASGRGVPQALLAYGRGIVTLRGVALSGDCAEDGKGTASPFGDGKRSFVRGISAVSRFVRRLSGLSRRPFCLVSAARGLVSLVLPRARSAARNTCARCVTIGARSNRQRPRVSASSCVSGARTRQIPFASSAKSREVRVRSSNRSRTNASTAARIGSIASSANESRLRWSAWSTPSVGSRPTARSARRDSDSSRA